VQLVIGFGINGAEGACMFELIKLDELLVESYIRIFVVIKDLSGVYASLEEEFPFLYAILDEIDEPLESIHVFFD
jgi:hypothetical protein